MKIVITLLRSLMAVVLFAATAVHAGAPEGKVVCFGDSITAGESSWVSLIGKKDDRLKMVNAGKGGRKTSQKAELAPVIQANKDAACFFLFLGVNDIKYGSDASVKACVANMADMIQRIKAEVPAAQIVVLAPCHVDLKKMAEKWPGKKFNDHANENLAQLEVAYKALAAEKSVKFISLLNIVSLENLHDGLHPGPEGQQQLAEVIWREFSKF